MAGTTSFLCLLGDSVVKRVGVGGRQVIEQEHLGLLQRPGRVDSELPQVVGQCEVPDQVVFGSRLTRERRSV